MATLDREAVELLLAESRTRGEYIKQVRTFFESGDLAIDFTEKYPKKDAASLRNSVTQNVKKLQAENAVNGKETPAYQVILSNDHVVLVNMDVYRSQK